MTTVIKLYMWVTIGISKLKLFIQPICEKVLMIITEIGSFICPNQTGTQLIKYGIVVLNRSNHMIIMVIKR